MLPEPTGIDCSTPNLKDLLDDRLFQDHRNDLQLATAVRAVLHVDLEHVHAVEDGLGNRTFA